MAVLTAMKGRGANGDEDKDEDNTDDNDTWDLIDADEMGGILAAGGRIEQECFVEGCDERRCGG